MSVDLGIGHFLENFSFDLHKNDQIVRNYISKLHSGHITPPPTPTTSSPHYHLQLVNPHHQYSIKRAPSTVYSLVQPITRAQNNTKNGWWQA